jgi:hypothetical protein
VNNGFAWFEDLAKEGCQVLYNGVIGMDPDLMGDQPDAWEWLMLLLQTDHLVSLSDDEEDLIPHWGHDFLLLLYSSVVMDVCTWAAKRARGCRNVFAQCQKIALSALLASCGLTHRIVKMLQNPPISFQNLQKTLQ